MMCIYHLLKLVNRLAKIKVGVIGVGNCASALVQGVEYYRDIDDEGECVGLRHLYVGRYHPRDIEFVCAFDVTTEKVGKDLSEAIFAEPNNTVKFVDVPKLDVEVLKGPVLDGISEYAKGIVKVDSSPEVDVAQSLKESGAEIVINLLPSGAPKASFRYAEESLKAGCAFINATPTFIASDDSWAERYAEAGLPIVGDDLTDQVGATFLHKVLLETLNKRGVRVYQTYQLDVGGGTESADTLERSWEAKRKIKTESVMSVLPYRAEVVAGSTDFVEFLKNGRDSYFWLEGLYFGGVPLRMDIRLSTVDAPNGGSILLDAIRGVKIALERKDVGHILSISAYAFKHPKKILPLLEADNLFEKYTGTD
ncbi:inositol-3-phosphate synthase [Candidatus Bathyarchaeota archaeon]|nr:MAG: inositol-3-phosphate synthase [Candidatus Bathyarchaeota archaeon]